MHSCPFAPPNSASISSLPSQDLKGEAMRQLNILAHPARPLLPDYRTPRLRRGVTLVLHGSSGRMAERVGFEPTVRFPAHTLSKRAP